MVKYLLLIVEEEFIAEQFPFVILILEMSKDYSIILNSLNRRPSIERCEFVLHNERNIELFSLFGDSLMNSMCMFSGTCLSLRVALVTN